jgi:small subunit ribosomal protein S6
MAMYETIFILDSLLTSEEIDNIIKRVSDLIVENGGKVVKVDKWGKKRLAYEIEKKQYGFYVAIVFESTGNVPTSLVSEYNYNDKVLRYLTYRFDKRKMKAWEAEKSAPAQAKPEEAPAETPAAEAKEVPAAEVAEAPVAATNEAPKAVEGEEENNG